jgi:hypothetical protein
VSPTRSIRDLYHVGQPIKTGYPNTFSVEFSPKTLSHFGGLNGRPKRVPSGPKAFVKVEHGHITVERWDNAPADRYFTIDQFNSFVKQLIIDRNP